MEKKFIFILIALISLFSIVFVVNKSDAKIITFDDEITIYKTPQCGCCSVFSTYIDNKGGNVAVRNVPSLNELFNSYNVPLKLRSCHISFIGDYYVVGHVPADVINDLMIDKPDIAGIALPNMPIGTPGMPGIKSEDWVIYALEEDGSYSEYQII